MIQGRSSVEIARPVTTVYDFVVVHFFENYPRWSPQVRELEPLNGERIALGTRGRQVRVDRGRRSETTFEVTRLEPESAVDFDGNQQARFAIRYRLEPTADNGCWLQVEFELKELTWLMRPFERLIRRAIREGTQETADNIKALVEQER